MTGEFSHSAVGEPDPADIDVTSIARAFLARVSTPAGLLDPSGTLAWANDALVGLLGGGPVPNIGRRIEPRPVGGGHGPAFLTETVGADGARLLMSWTAVPLGGLEIGSAVVGQDVTDDRGPDAMFRRLVEQLPAATYIDRLDGPTLYISPQIEAMTGFTSEEWIADSALWERRLLHPEDRVRLLSKDEAAFERGTPWSDEYRIVAKDGTVRWVAEKAQVVLDDDGNPSLMQGVMFDVTEQREMLAALKAAESRYRQLIEAIPAAVYLDADGGQPTAPMYISPRIERMLGYSMHDWDTIPDLWTKLLHHEDREAAVAESHRAKEEGTPFSMDYRMMALDGRTVWIHDEAIPVHASDGSIYWQGFLLDVTERREAEAQIAYLAYHDSLTGLPTRQRFDEELERALHRAARSGRGLGVLSVNLDLFRLVNESLGHAAGDALLREVAERLAGSLRTTDVFARRTGDEFLVLLEDIDPVEPEAAALQAAGRLQDVLHDPFTVEGNEVFVSATIGASVLTIDTHASDALVRQADAAREQGKRRGPGTVTLHRDGADPDESTPEERLRLAARLRRAVERDEWILHFQPIVDLRTREIVAAEALLRWVDPDGVTVPPDRFVPLAETLGLIDRIGRWVVDEACRHEARWTADRFPLRVTFNVSPREFWQPELATRILQQVRDAGLPPSSLIIEITESAAMSDPHHTARVVDELRTGGLGLAIDGFGTGSSSLSRLTELRPEFLKIDRSFVARTPGALADEAIVRAMVALADTLGLATVAVGVETVEQEAFLLAQGCALGQGFRYSRPVPAAQLTEMLGATLV